MTLKKSLIPFQMPSQSPLIRAVTVLIMFLIVLIAVSTTVLIVFHTISKIFLIEFQTMSQTDLRVFMDPSMNSISGGPTLSQTFWISVHARSEEHTS